MLRSIQQLRTSSSAGSMLGGDDGHLALVGGGGDYRMPWHWHDCLMILLPHVGAVNLCDESKKAGSWVSEDRFVVVPKAAAHQTSAARIGHRHVAIYVSDFELSRIEVELGSLTRAHAKIGKSALFTMTPEIRSLLSICQMGDPADKVTRITRSQLSATLLINCIAQIERSEELPAAQREGHGAMLVAEMKSFISQNANSDLPLDTIADLFGISRRHATRLFRENTGLSILAYQEHERIKQARDLLSGTTLPVGEIAWRVGFESGSALARAMRRVAGMTPTSIRRSMARSDNL